LPAIPDGTTTTFPFSFFYSPTTVNPQAIFQDRVILPSQFTFQGFNFSGAGNSANVCVYKNNVIIQGTMPNPANPLQVNLKLKPDQTGAFIIPTSPFLNMGGNSNPNDDFPFSTGIIFDPMVGPDSAVGPLKIYAPTSLYPFQHANIEVPVLNLGGAPANNVQLKISAPSGAGLVVPPQADPNITFDPSTLTFNLGHLPAPDQSIVRFGVYMNKEGTASVGVQIVQSESDPQSNNNHATTTFNVLPPPSTDNADFGDAPDTYSTLKTSGGPWHTAVGTMLGATRSTEGDGAPTTGANSDSGDDGIVLLDPLVPGSTARIEVNIPAMTFGLLDAWIDWNQNGKFDEIGNGIDPWEYLPDLFTERNGFDPNSPITTSAASLFGPQTFHLKVPSNAKLGSTIARFRLSSEGNLGPGGGAPDGEVEDYAVEVVSLPDILIDSFTAVLPGRLVPNQRGIGKIVVRNGGSAPATGVKLTVDPGSDGVFLPPAQLPSGVTVSGNSFLLGSPLDPGASKELSFEYAAYRVFDETIQVHAEQAENDPDPENNYGSIGISIDPEPPPPFDFGDAPDTYHTLTANNGARHSIVANGPILGLQIDADPDGQPSPHADGDDLDAHGDDEDGVVFRGPLVAGITTLIDITVSKNCLLDAWIDYNGDGAFTADEYICGDLDGATFTLGVADPFPLVAGVNHVYLHMPNSGYRAVPTFARFRVSSTGRYLSQGIAADGEVEDYQVQIFDLAPDFGDAPDSLDNPRYPTLLAHNGAYHLASQAGFFLGQRIDFEADGHPTDDALGDDQDDGLEFPSDNNPDDEDGVTFTTPLRPGQTATINVFATIQTPGPAKLDAWIDWNQNFSWADPGEQILTSVDLLAGDNALQFVVPANAKTGTTFARFRLSRNGNLQPFGPADSGEVEDYQVQIGGQVAAPTLRYTVNSDGTFTLTFDSNAVLASAPDVAGPWANTGQHSPFTVNPNVTKMFFRAVIP
jgi:hypothetical protein